MWIEEEGSSFHKVVAARIEVTPREFKESSSLEIENEWCLRDLCIKLITVAKLDIAPLSRCRRC